jgi:hypothetical protein
MKDDRERLPDIEKSINRILDKTTCGREVLKS